MYKVSVFDDDDDVICSNVCDFGIERERESLFYICDVVFVDKWCSILDSITRTLLEFNHHTHIKIWLAYRV